MIDDDDDFYSNVECAICGHKSWVSPRYCWPHRCHLCDPDNSYFSERYEIWMNGVVRGIEIEREYAAFDKQRYEYIYPENI